MLLELKLKKFLNNSSVAPCILGSINPGFSAAKRVKSCSWRVFLKVCKLFSACSRANWSSLVFSSFLSAAVLRFEIANWFYETDINSIELNDSRQFNFSMKN